MDDENSIVVDSALPVQDVNRLSIRLFGVDYETAPGDVISRMIGDRKTILAKYSLPGAESYENKTDYAKMLIERAQMEGVTVCYVDKEVLDRAGLGGGTKEDGSLVIPKIDLESSSQRDVFNWSIKFAHELIHVFQDRDYPDMPIEEREYESYIATYLPTAVGIVMSSDQAGEITSFHERMMADNMLTLIKDSCLGYYRKIGRDLSTVEWMN